MVYIGEEKGRERKRKICLYLEKKINYLRYNYFDAEG